MWLAVVSLSMRRLTLSENCWELQREHTFRGHQVPSDGSRGGIQMPKNDWSKECAGRRYPSKRPGTSIHYHKNADHKGCSGPSWCICGCHVEAKPNKAGHCITLGKIGDAHQWQVNCMRCYAVDHFLAPWGPTGVGLELFERGWYQTDGEFKGRNYWMCPPCGDKEVAEQALIEEVSKPVNV